MALDERMQLGALDIEYGRGHIWQDEYYRTICNDLATHYGLGDNANNTFFWLTNKGIWAQRLSLEATAFHLKDQNPAIVLFRSPYFEVNKFPGRLNEVYGIDLPGTTTRVKDYQELSAAAESAKESKKPLIIYFDSISSYPDAKAADTEAIFQIASANYQSDSDVPCFIIADMTTCAGVFQIFDKAKAKIGNSRVNLIATQSMLKYWQWGMDFDPLGAIIAFGPDVAPSLKNPLYKAFSQFYYFHLAEPSLKLLSFLPPIDSEYMKYRAARIDRNTAHGVSVIEEDCRSQNIQGVKVSYAGSKNENKKALDQIGFKGSYCFLAFPSKDLAKKFVDSIAAQSPQALGAIQIGVSFGHDHLRICQLGDSATVRVAFGTEDICTTHFVAKRIVHSLRKTLQE